MREAKYCDVRAAEHFYKSAINEKYINTFGSENISGASTIRRAISKEHFFYKYAINENYINTFHFDSISDAPTIRRAISKVLRRWRNASELWARARAYPYV